MGPNAGELLSCAIFWGLNVSTSILYRSCIFRYLGVFAMNGSLCSIVFETRLLLVVRLRELMACEPASDSSDFLKLAPVNYEFLLDEAFEKSTLIHKRAFL